MAKGARKGGSRLAAASEPLSCGEFHLHEGRARRFLTQFIPRTSWPGLRADYDALLAGLALAEAWEALIPFDSPAPELNELAEGSLSILEAGGAPWPCLAWALVQALEAEGQGRDWMACSATGRRIAERPAYLSGRLGGPVGREAAASDPGAMPVDPEVLIALNRLRERPSPPPSFPDASQALRALHHHWRGLSESPLRALVQAAEQASLSRRE